MTSSTPPPRPPGPEGKAARQAGAPEQGCPWGGGVSSWGVSAPIWCLQSSSLLRLSGKQKDFSVGRFQVTPFKAPPTDHRQPRPPHQVMPIAHSPPASSQSESSESSTEEGSPTGSSITPVPPAGHLLGYHDNQRAEQQDRRGDEAGEGAMEWRCSAPLISSDESDSEREEMWAELHELRER